MPIVLQTGLTHWVIEDNSTYADQNPEYDENNFVAAVIVDTVSEFFYFWITYFLVLLLGTRWEYTSINLSEHVHANEHDKIMNFLLKKSAVFSVIFSVLRVAIAMLYKVPMNVIYDSRFNDQSLRRLFKILRSSFITIYSLQRYWRHRKRVHNFVEGKINSTIRKETVIAVTNHSLSMIASNAQFLPVIVANSEEQGSHENFKRDIDSRVGKYFELHSEELKEFKEIIEKGKAVAMHRNPKETPLVGAIYLLFIVISNLIYVIFAVAIEITMLLNRFEDFDKTLDSMNYALEVMYFALHFIDLLFVSLIISLILKYKNFFGNALELNLRSN